jgi:hypothetical protein
MGAFGRLRSKSMLDKTFGLMFYMMIILVGALSVFAINDFVENRNLFWLFILGSTYLFVFTNIFTLRDYKNIYATHKGTIENYLAKINITESKLLGKGFKISLSKKSNDDFVFASEPYENNEFEGFYIIPLIFIVAFFVVGLININKEGELFIYFSIYNLLLVGISVFINADTLNNSAVSPELLGEFFDIENISEEEKDDFKEIVKEKIESNGFISRKEVFCACKPIIENQKSREHKNKVEIEKQKYDVIFKK